MSKQAVEKWHIAGFQAVHSACQQGSEAAQTMQQKSTDADLKQFAIQVKETMDRHGNRLADYLKDAGAPLDLNTLRRNRPLKPSAGACFDGSTRFYQHSCQTFQ